MSQDEIVFEEIRYREPVRMRRPDRDPRWACLAYLTPAPEDLPVFLDHGTADTIERHALRDTSVELGGILLGKECVDDVTGQPFVSVTRSLEAKHYENTQASFTYTHDSWEEITRERDRLYPELDIVGWYHTHPDFGVFLSSHDLFIQRHFFGQPMQLAYVVDPIRQTRSFFQWRGGVMAELGGFFLFAERDQRLLLARLANDLEKIPNTEPGGGHFSPRLEAELIAMLTRPAALPPSAVAAERAQTAVLFSLLGALLGAIGVAALVWMNALNGHIQDQAQTLQNLEKSVRESSDHQRVALDAALGNATGPPHDRFLEQYARATRERDLAKQQVANQNTINDALATKTRALNDEIAKLRSDYDTATRQAEENARDAKDASEYRDRVHELQATRAEQAQKIENLEELLDTVEGRKTAELFNKYKTARMAAVAGWTTTILLALAGIATYTYLQFRTHEPGDETPASHRIE